MAEDPGEGDGRGRTAVFFPQAGQFRVEGGEFPVSDEDAAEKSVIERRPRLHRNAVQAAVIEDVPVPLNRFVVVHIDVEPLFDHRRVHEGKLQLIGDDLNPAPLQQFDLIG